METVGKERRTARSIDMPGVGEASLVMPDVVDCSDIDSSYGVCC